jgi:hypothetical protein
MGDVYIMDTGFWALFREFTGNDVGRGILLATASFPVGWVQYALGQALKAYSPPFLHPKIPAVLTGIGFVMAAVLLGPLSQFISKLTMAELMLVASTATAGAKIAHDTQKIKKLKGE